MNHASQFILDAPPGQFNDVYNDVHTLSGSPIDFEAVLEHNKQQLITLSIPDQIHKMIISPESVLDESTLIDPRTGSLYTVDHIQLTCEKRDESGLENEAELVTKRNRLDKALEEYVNNHFPNGASSVFVTPDGFKAYIVGNKYNPSNFWAGRWRGSLNIPHDLSTFELEIKAQVHYYEDGNVQLNTNQTFTGTLDGDSSDARIQSLCRLVLKCDAQFQSSINYSFADGSVNTFKALRRALPITKSKIEWPSILACIAI